MYLLYKSESVTGSRLPEVFAYAIRTENVCQENYIAASTSLQFSEITEPIDLKICISFHVIERLSDKPDLNKAISFFHKNGLAKKKN